MKLGLTAFAAKAAALIGLGSAGDGADFFLLESKRPHLGKRIFKQVAEAMRSSGLTGHKATGAGQARQWERLKKQRAVWDNTPEAPKTMSRQQRRRVNLLAAKAERSALREEHMAKPLWKRMGWDKPGFIKTFEAKGGRVA